MNSFVMLPLACLALMGAITNVNAAQCEPEKVAEKYPTLVGKVIRIAASPAQPPISYSNPDNHEQLIGFEAELIQNAMACSGLKFEYFLGTWSGLLPTLISGSTDLMIGSVNYRPERAEKADFILYARAGQSVIVPKGNPKNIKTMNDVCGLTGSANLSGSSSLSLQKQSLQCVANGFRPINYLPADSGDAAYRQIPTGRADFVMDDSVAAHDRAVNNQSIEIVQTVITDIYTGMVVAKGNKAMLQLVADGIRVQQQDGRFKALAEKYGLPEETLIPIETRQ